MPKITIRDTLQKGLAPLEQRNVDTLVDLKNVFTGRNGITPYIAVTKVTKTNGPLGESFPFPQFVGNQSALYALGQDKVYSIVSNKATEITDSIVEWYSHARETPLAGSISWGGIWHSAIFEKNFIATNAQTMLFSLNGVVYSNNAQVPISACAFRNRMILGGVDGWLDHWIRHNALDAIGTSGYGITLQELTDSHVLWAPLNGSSLLAFIDFGYAMEGMAGKLTSGNLLYNQLLTVPGNPFTKGPWGYTTKEVDPTPIAGWSVVNSKLNSATAGTGNVTYTLSSSELSPTGIYKLVIDIDETSGNTGYLILSISGATETVGATVLDDSGRYFYFFQHSGTPTITFTNNNFIGSIVAITLYQTNATKTKNELRTMFQQNEWGYVLLGNRALNGSRSDIVAMSVLADGIVVYCEDSVYALSPAGEHFKIIKVADFGIFKRGAFANAQNTHIFMDKAGRLWSIDYTFKLEPMFYDAKVSSVISSDSTVCGCYDKRNRRAYLSFHDADDTDGSNDFSLILSETGMSAANEAVTDILEVSSDGSIVGYSGADMSGTRLYFTAKTQYYDFGLDGIKTIRNIQIDGDCTGLYGRLWYKLDLIGQPKKTDWIPVDATGSVSFFVSGVAAALELRATDYTKVRISSITFNFDEGRMLSTTKAFKRY
jgi:hypothetical protein